MKREEREGDALAVAKTGEGDLPLLSCRGRKEGLHIKGSLQGGDKEDPPKRTARLRSD